MTPLDRIPLQRTWRATVPRRTQGRQFTTPHRAQQTRRWKGGDETERTLSREPRQDDLLSVSALPCEKRGLSARTHLEREHSGVAGNVLGQPTKKEYVLQQMRH